MLSAITRALRRAETKKTCRPAPGFVTTPAHAQRGAPPVIGWLSPFSSEAGNLNLFELARKKHNAGGEPHVPPVVKFFQSGTLRRHECWLPDGPPPAVSDVSLSS
jgi:hypothetical protein